MGPVLASENDVDDTNRRVVLVRTNLKLPCSPTGAEGRFQYYILNSIFFMSFSPTLNIIIIYEDILEYFTWSKNGVLLPDHSSTALQSRFIIQSDFSLL
jgi:hypothetical protein